MKRFLSIFVVLLVLLVSASVYAGEKSTTTLPEQNIAKQCPADRAQPQVQIAGRGCCSWHGGVCGCVDGRAKCCDGSLSPTCGCMVEDIQIFN